MAMSSEQVQKGYEGEAALPSGKHVFEQPVFEQASAKILPEDLWSNPAGWIPFVNRVVKQLKKAEKFSKYAPGDLFTTFMAGVYNPQYSRDQICTYANGLMTEFQQFPYLYDYVKQFWNSSDYTMGLKPKKGNPNRRDVVLTYEAYVWEREHRAEALGFQPDEASLFEALQNGRPEVGPKSDSTGSASKYWRGRKRIKGND